IESNHFFCAHNLFQQYGVDAWATAEQARLNFLQFNQDKLHADWSWCSGSGVHCILSADVDGNDLGQHIILPSSFTGSSQFMMQNLQDTLALCCHFSGSDLFLMMTANPQWPEVLEALLPGQTPADCPDLVTCVFHLKVKALLEDIYTQGVLGHAVAKVYTIEFQKHGLPHMHFIIFLAPESKLRTPEDG
ncbi:hypothetical protein PAXRUDRAFT_159919, partial [Paxillus rubicundulus Ve08.2h10]